MAGSAPCRRPGRREELAVVACATTLGVMSQEQVPGGEPLLAALLAALTEAEALLRERGDTHWADWLERDRARIARGDAYGLDHVKQAFGGMGSINDDYPPDDDEIGARLGKIYVLAAQLLAQRQHSGGRAVM
jgi:hypothetical protein